MSHRAIGALCLLLGLGCATPGDSRFISAAEPVVERIGDRQVTLRWDRVAELAPIRVYVGRTPDSIDRRKPVGIMSRSEVKVSGLAPGQRYFFELVDVNDEARIVSERLLPLQGAKNFRDLGGYATGDGRRVRWAQLYRSDDLADLNKEDLLYLSRLQIRLVCDFRSESERTKKRNRLPADDPPQVANLDISDERFDPSKIGSLIRGRSLEGVDFAKLMIEGNRAFATDFSPQYATMFERIGEPENRPTLVHCTQGKDRTGFAAAVVLRALGVPQDVVMEDYLLTNVYTANQIERTMMLIRVYMFFQDKSESIRPLLQVRRDYLTAAFDAIDEEYGSFDEYLREGLGVSDAERERLQAALLR